MNDLTLTISLWLPVGRANFYSSSANNWLTRPPTATGTAPASSMVVADPGYRPRLQVSVLRRVLEVLPVSFGYDPDGSCVFGDGDDLKRPVAVTMTLRPKPDVEQWAECPAKWASVPLVRAGVHQVTLRVDEHGAYTFTAKARFDADADVRGALAAHVREVFGGDYSLDRRTSLAPAGGADTEGGAAVRRYQGLGSAHPAAEEKPRGILTFFQLNTIAEGLFNESLSPAVFFEQNDDLETFLAEQIPGSITMVHTMAEVIDLLKVDDLDAASPVGLALALRRFLDVTSREVLQKLKWSVESVRRSLLDESVGMLHRQSKLVQLDLGALKKEWMPELAVGASESQLRGYVMLAAAKLPLVGNVHEFAQLAKEHLSEVVHAAAKAPAIPAQGAHAGTAGGVLTTHGGPVARNLGEEVRRLDLEIKHWSALLAGLRNNVQRLENAIEHAWRENLLYEQRAVRSEQEAMAEIQRSRTGRPTERANMNAYNVLMLLFTVAAVIVAVREGKVLDPGAVSTDWGTWARALSPIALVTIIFTLVVPFTNRLRQRAREKQGYNGTYPYEFAFRLEEAADPTKVYAYLANREQRTLTTTVLKELTVTSQGGGRIERVSQHRALVKIHSIATFNVGKGHYARFEVVNEILAHRVSGKPTFMIIQCRMFGDSPRALAPTEVLELSTVVLDDVGNHLTGRDPARGDEAGIKVPAVLELITPLLSTAQRPGAGSTTARPPTQRS